MTTFLQNLLHYYGDTVRTLFLVAGGVLIVSVPVFPDLLPFHPLYIVLLILALGMLAGFTSPTQRFIIILDMIFSVLAFIVFELSVYENTAGVADAYSMLFLVRQGLALIFFFALYYSVKTFRGTLGTGGGDAI